MKTHSTPTLASVASHDLLAVAAWIVGDDTGSSSKYMLATALAGIAPPAKFGPSWPRDAADLGRCLRLIERAPSVASALPVLAECSPKWKALAEGWGELTKLFSETDDKDEYRWRVVTSAMDRMIRSANNELSR
jgi:hypothetical protein